MRNCTRDEGRSFEVGNQVLISSHRKLLLSKSNGGERCGNVGTGFRQARLREASASEPLQKCRNRIRWCQNRGLTRTSSGDVLRLPERHPACRRREAQPGSCTERENLNGDAKGKDTSGSNREAESTDAPVRGGLLRISDEAE